MSTERIIHQADITFIENSLRSLSADIGAVSNQVKGVGQQVVDTRSELARLQQAFMDFVAADAKTKEVSLAETRLIKIRQELETKFGYYGEVRRHAIGILQAADISIVRQETVNSATESLMLSAPRYWLAPALVALAAWLTDNKPLAEKALAEAIRRDDEKTSLFFALITHRAARAAACRIWLERYLGMQDPSRLDRQSVVLIDALASGIFGLGIRGHCVKHIESWIDELSQHAGFKEEQRKQWNEALRSKIPTTNNASRYQYLSQYSSTWAVLNDVLNGAAMHAIVRDHFKSIFDGAILLSSNLKVAVDELLDKLVQNFDDEELPLRRDEMLCELIIAEGGDRDAARKRFDLESKALDEKISFTQLLTNAAMHPETSHASLATQRLAIALSKCWIKEAYQDVSAEIRAAVPIRIELAIENWNGTTTNGENEKELATALGDHIDRRRDDALASIKLDFQHWAGLVIGVGLILSAMSGDFLSGAVGAGCLIWFYIAKSNITKKRAKIVEDFAKLREQSLQVLSAACAEVVEWRRDFDKRDAIFSEVVHLLDTMSPEQYALSTHDTVRQVMAKHAA